MTDVFDYTVCGLRVVPNLPAEHWTGFSTHAQATDVLGAYAFGQVDVANDVSTDQHISTDLALACAHVGHVETTGQLALATDWVTRDHIEAERRRVQRMGEDYEWFTVCGIDRYAFATFCMPVEARSWFLAWVDVCDQVRELGASPLTARIHPGWRPAIQDDQLSGYADPLALDEEMMRHTATDKWGQRWLGR